MITSSEAMGWVVTIAFAVTCTVTLGALIGKFKIKEKYLTPLFVKLILEVIAAGLFLFYSGHSASEPPPYIGEWRGTVYWYDSYARVIFNYGDMDPEFQPINPRSEGTLYFYESKSGVYKGVSTWETKNGENTYAKVVALHGNFEFEPSGTLKSVCVMTVFRKPIRQFSYGPYTRYHMQFTHVSDSQIWGKMIVYMDGKEMEVGDVILERE
jgi:hypothetical protein